MGRKQSKRIPLKRKHNVEKKIADHNKKMRRLSKNVKKKNRKDPGVPNSLPFKEEILREIALRKQQVKDEEAAKKQAKKEARLQAKNPPKPQSLEELCESAESRGIEHENNEPKEPIGLASTKSRKYYFKEFKKVVLAADVILEVLDARDPMSCRCFEVEQEVLKAGKKLVLVMNKIDLVPKQNAVDWIKYLRREFPTIPFKASLQKQRSALGTYKLKFTKATTSLLSNSKTFGSDVLLKLIANYSRNNDIKTAITIGVIGLPNVGKSSIINSLKRSKACNVGSYPGITKSMQEIHLDSRVKLLDSPGVIMQKSVDKNSLILRNCIPLENVTDAVSVVNHMMQKMKGNQLSLHYKVASPCTTEQLLAAIARKRGILKKGGVANIEKAAKLLINEWTTGVINYYTQPPKLSSVEANEKQNGSAEIVSELSVEFDIDALLNEADGSTPAEVEQLIDDVYVPVEPEGRLQCVNEVALEQETIVEVASQDNSKMDADMPSTDPSKRPRVVRFSAKPPREDGMDEDDDDGEDIDDTYESAMQTRILDNITNSDGSGIDQFSSGGKLMTVNKKMKLHMKHIKKMKKRSAKIDSKLSEVASASMDIDVADNGSKKEKYDFSEHFNISTK